MGRASDDDDQRTRGVGQLARLQVHERALAERLAEARGEAARIVEEARAAAERAEIELEASLGEEVRRLREESRAELRARLREIASEADERAVRFERVSDGRIRELADLAFRHLVGAGGSP